MSRPYEPAEIVTASHILYKDFIANTKWKSVPKVVYYIVMNNAYGEAFEKDAAGLLGRRLKLVTPQQ